MPRDFNRPSPRPSPWKGEGDCREMKRLPSGSLEVDEAALDVDGLQRHRHRIADVQAVESTDQPALDGRPPDPYPGALGRGAGDERVEGLADPMLQDQRGRRLPDLALHLGRRV